MDNEFEQDNGSLEISKNDFPNYDYYKFLIQDLINTADQVDYRHLPYRIEYGKTNIDSEQIPFVFNILNDSYFGLLTPFGYRIIPCNTKDLNSSLDQMTNQGLVPILNVGIEENGKKGFQYIEEFIIPFNGRRPEVIEYNMKGKIVDYSVGYLFLLKQNKRVKMRDFSDFVNKYLSLYYQTEKVIENINDIRKPKSIRNRLKKF